MCKVRRRRLSTTVSPSPTGDTSRPSLNVVRRLGGHAICPSRFQIGMTTSGSARESCLHTCSSPTCRQLSPDCSLCGSGPDCYVPCLKSMRVLKTCTPAPRMVDVVPNRRYSQRCKWSRTLQSSSRLGWAYLALVQTTWRHCCTAAGRMTVL